MKQPSLAGNRLKSVPSNRRRSRSTASCISRCPTTSGRSTRARAGRSGITTTRPKATTSAIAASPCTRAWLYFRRPTRTWLPGRAQRRGALESRTGRSEARILRHHGAAGRPQSRDRRRLGRVTDIPGFLESLDPEDRQDAMAIGTPSPSRASLAPRLGRRQAMPSAHGGGMTWMTGTYDPELNLVYWGTGNPNPVLAGDRRARATTCTPARSSR